MIRLLTIFVFLFFLISPVFGWIGRINVQLNELRELETMPAVSFEGIRSGEFFRSFDRFFNDHFAYRVGFIKTKNWIDYHIFRTSPTQDVYVGIEDWLYLHESPGDFLKINGCTADQTERMRNVARQIHHLERLIEGSGRRFFFVVALNKDTIYPEYLGTTPLRGDPCAKSRYDMFLDSLHDYPVSNFIRVDPLLLNAKKNGQLYFRTDTHWNHYAGQIVSEEILSHIAPRQGKNYLPKVRFSSKRQGGDLSRMISLNIEENSPFIDEIHYPTQVRMDVTEFHPEKDWNNLRYTSFSPSGMPLLPKAIFYRDSFANFLTPFLAGAFEQLDVIWYQNYGPYILKPAYAEELRSSKIVIFEIVERWLPNVQVDLPSWEAALRDRPIDLPGERIKGAIGERDRN